MAQKQGAQGVCPGENVCVHSQGAAKTEAGQFNVAGLHLILMSQQPT